MKNFFSQVDHMFRYLADYANRKGWLTTYIPRWIVLVLDVLLTALAYLVVLGCFRLLTHYVPADGVAYRFMTVMGVYLAMELFWGVYRGTVRYSGLSEMVRLFVFVLTSIFVSAIVLHVTSTAVPQLRISPLWLLFHGTIAFMLMFMLRICVKYIFYFATASQNKRTRVIVYGVDANTLAFAQMLATDTAAQYKPVALIDDNGGSRAGMRLGSIPVERAPKTHEEVIHLCENHRAMHVLFRQETLRQIPSEIMDLMLSVQLKLLVVGEAANLDDHNKKARLSVNEIKIDDLLNRDVIKTDNPVVAEKHAGRVVLVTGAAGSIGSEVVKQVAKFNPSQLILFDQAESPLYEIELKMKELYPKLNTVIFIGDVRNEARMEYLFKTYQPEVIYHAAAYKHVPMMERYPSEAILANVMGTRTLANLAVKYNARKFVMISTDKAVNPTNVMGCSKRIAEIYVQSLYLSLAPLKEEHKHRTRFITTRFGNVLGSNGSVVPLFKAQIAKGGPVTLTHKDIIRYFMTIPEACRLVLEAGCMGRGGEIFVFDMGKPVKIYDLAKRMIQLSGLVPGKDIQIVETGLRPGEKLYEELLNDHESTLPTHNEKIKIARVREYDYQEVNVAIDRLVALAKEGNDFDVVREMKRIVPEYKSRNSVFERLDLEDLSGQEELHEIVHEEVKA